jgi:hypothetical protein
MHDNVASYGESTDFGNGEARSGKTANPHPGEIDRSQRFVPADTASVPEFTARNRDSGNSPPEPAPR